jgi:hypothetical protein
MRRAVWAVLLAFVCSGLARGQVVRSPIKDPALLSQASAGLAAQPDPVSQLVPLAATESRAAPSIPVLLTVPTGTPLQVALDKEVRIRKAGQPIHGKVVEPVYAFDKLVVPAGSEVIGEVASIERVPGKKRTISIMNGDFTPDRDLRLEFHELVLTTGEHVPLSTVVTPGSDGVLQFVAADEKQKGKTGAAKNMVSQKVSEARQEIKRDWEMAKKQVHEPGKMHRLERYAVAQLPIHPQYMDVGLRFNAELQKPLDFGSETLKLEAVSAIGTPPPAGSMVHALLVTPLSSATTKKDAPVEAVITQPLFDSGHLILPEGSRLLGSVIQVRPARRLGRNGLLRIVFHQVVPPNGLQQKVDASLEGVEVGKGEHLRLDSEGGAEVTTPKRRYLTTGISVALAATSFSSDTERGRVDPGGDTSRQAANGAFGFGFIGTIVTTFAHSRAVSSGFGVYGAGLSVYSRFLARGSYVVYPKDTAMIVGFGTRTNPAGESPASIGPLPMAPRPLLWPT